MHRVRHQAQRTLAHDRTIQRRAPESLLSVALLRWGARAGNSGRQECPLRCALVVRLSSCRRSSRCVRFCCGACAPSQSNRTRTDSPSPPRSVLLPLSPPPRLPRLGGILSSRHSSLPVLPLAMSSYGGSRLTPSTRGEHLTSGGAAGRDSIAGGFYDGQQIPVEERSSVSGMPPQHRGSELQTQQTQRGSISQQQQQRAAASDAESAMRPAALSTVSSTSDSSSYSRSTSISATAPSAGVAAAPAAASSRGALALPAHPTTPSPHSSDSALEAAAGINSQKLSPADFIFGRCLGEGSFAKVVLATRRSTGERYACKMVDKNFVQKMGKIQTVMNEKKVRDRRTRTRQHTQQEDA